ncbi:MAG: hypothetical protein NTV98_00835, partial [Candidatus Roizmanbacteria bacterium]|nr:hypothetical protein [Candidatus Roizmanbacteria bacterium]
ILKDNDTYHLLYRAIGDEQIINKKKLRVSVIGKAESIDGIHFQNRTKFIEPENIWETYGCEDPRITKMDGKYFIFYTALGNYPPNARGIRVGLAISNDLKTITEKHLITPFNAKAMTLFPEKINNLYTVLLSVNTDNPPSSIGIAQFEKIETLWDPLFWNDWYKNVDKHLVYLKRVNSDQVEIGAPPLKTNHGWILIYSYIKHYLSENVSKEFRIEAVLLDLKDPKKIAGRVEKALLIPGADYELNGTVPNIVFPEGALIEDNTVKIYYGGADTFCALATIELNEFISQFEINTPYTLKCNKFPNNPLLLPDPEHEWESKAVFNPAAIEINNTTYLIYRTMSQNNLSYLGLAISSDGQCIDERLETPIYPFRSVYEKPKRDGLPGGCEDPRITRIDDMLYMCYTAYDGELARLAMTSITVDNFLQRNFTLWAEPKIISPPNVMDKDGVLFPEKIDGKYVFFHRIEPNIIIDSVDNLLFENNSFLGQQGYIVPRTGSWDGVKIGINTPPIKTPQGWLAFYHGISSIDKNYRLGALLLDLKDVTKVLSQTIYPLLEPETIFEKKGIVDNVVFPCGCVQRGDDIFLYYGGADEVICGASISLSRLLAYLLAGASKKYLT